MNAQIRAVIFDLDGTLVDTMGDFADKASQLMAAYYDVDRAWAREQYMNTSGYPFGQQLEQLFGDHPSRLEVAERFESWKLELLDRCLVEPRPGVKQMIHSLQEADYRVAISSNNGQAIVDHLVADWDIALDSALGYRDEGFSKGEPHFHWLQRELEVTRSEFLFVGDSLNDLRFALRSQVSFAAVTYTFPEDSFLRSNHRVKCFGDVTEVGDWLLSSFRTAPGGKNDP